MTANDVDRDSGDGAASYGTRSRNRTGNSRPNYAEDKDIEMDNYEYYDKKDGDTTKKSSRLAAANGDSARSGSQRKAASDDPDAGAAQNGNKDTGSLASSNPQGGQNLAASAASRKRKAAAAGQQPTATSTGSQRRTGNSTPSSTTNWPESNMLTFENCKGRPHKGQMIADDGTVLEPNGMFTRPSLAGAEPPWCQFPLCVAVGLRSRAQRPRRKNNSIGVPPCTKAISRRLTLVFLHRPRLLGVRAAGRAVLPGAHHGISACEG